MTIRKEAFDRVSYDRARYLANAETVKARRKEYYKKNRERILKQQRDYKARNRGAILSIRKIAEGLGVSIREAREML